MARTSDYYTKFEEGSFYHIYNRSVDQKPLFKSPENYRFFLLKFNQYLGEVLDLYAYCLLGNHFHLLIRIKEDLEAQKTVLKKSTHDVVSKQFRQFFQSYAMTFNLKNSRIGTLFQTPFKRSHIQKEDYFTKIILYIHLNPQKHKLIPDFRDWPWSSYHKICSDKQSKLMKIEVLEWFGGKDYYVKSHIEAQELLNF